MAKYRVLVGLDYPPNKRAEAGDEVEDLPSSSIKWLLADGLVEEIEGTTKFSKKTFIAPEPKIKVVEESSDELDEEA